MIKTLLVLASLFASIHAGDLPGNSRDSSTYANIETVYTTHTDLDFEVDFDKKVLDGHVVHTMHIEGKEVSSVFYDAVGLVVSNAEFIGVHGGC